MHECAVCACFVSFRSLDCCKNIKQVWLVVCDRPSDSVHGPICRERCGGVSCAPDFLGIIIIIVTFVIVYGAHTSRERVHRIKTVKVISVIRAVPDWATHPNLYAWSLFAATFRFGGHVQFTSGRDVRDVCAIAFHCYEEMRRARTAFNKFHKIAKTHQRRKRVQVENRNMFSLAL